MEEGQRSTEVASLPRGVRLRPRVLLALVGSMACGVMLGTSVFFKVTGYIERVGDDYALLTALQRVSDAYVEEVPRAQLIDNAMRGLVAGLDAHSTFLDEADLALVDENANGEFGGIGVELELVDGYFTVVSPIADSPAERAGIQAGDRIVEVDHESLRGRSWTETIADLRGEPGTALHVRVRRDVGQSLDFDLTRDAIAVPSVQSRMLDGDVGYVRITQFSTTTRAELENAVAGLAEEAVLVLDLRNNPGGLFEAAIAVADAFLADGVIVSTVGRLPGSDRSFSSSSDDLLDGAPLAVLIDGGSASASEIVAAALKDHGRATLLGTSSFGKGSLQTVLALGHTRGIKLTTGRYLTPNGQALGADGIEPHIVLKRERDEPQGHYDRRLLRAAMEAVLPG